MQTFLPYSDFEKTAYCLDNKRLGKQRIEVIQILEESFNPNHPAIIMWRDYKGCLAEYGLIICEEWLHRGFKDSCSEQIYEYLDANNTKPFWLGDEEFHSRHRAALLFKNFGYYSQFHWKEEPLLDYWWPL